MLASIVLSLTTEDDCDVPEHVGRAAHAILLETVRSRAPELAAQLHEDASAKPFTASSLLDGPTPSGAIRHLHGGQIYRLRFTSLSAPLTEVLLSAFGRPPAELSLDDTRMKVVSTASDSTQDPLAGTASYRDLASTHLVQNMPVPGKIALEFLSPTTFRSAGRNVPLPLPELVFGSLLDRWNAFSPVHLDGELRRFAHERLAVSRYQLRTELVSVGGGKQVGFRGWCEYTALNRDAFWLRQVHLLASFAFYAGVGYKTTMGLGQTRRLTDASALSRRAGRYAP